MKEIVSFSKYHLIKKKDIRYHQILCSEFEPLPQLHSTQIQHQSPQILILKSSLMTESSSCPPLVLTGQITNSTQMELEVVGTIILNSDFYNGIYLQGLILL